MKKHLIWSLVAGVALAGGVAAGAFAASPTTTPQGTTTVTTTQESVDLQSGANDQVQSSTGVDQEKASLGEASASTGELSTDPAGGPDLNVQSGAQVGGTQGGADSAAGN